jgi:hypothetical protein
MKKTSAILGIVGSSIGIIGGLFQSFIGGVATAFEAEDAELVASLGMWALLFSLVALICSCFIFKRPKPFSWIVAVLGLACLICGNYLSGLLILGGGIVGIFSKSQSNN